MSSRRHNTPSAPARDRRVFERAPRARARASPDHSDEGGEEEEAFDAEAIAPLLGGADDNKTLGRPRGSQLLRLAAEDSDEGSASGSESLDSDGTRDYHRPRPRPSARDLDEDYDEYLDHDDDDNVSISGSAVEPMRGWGREENRRPAARDPVRPAAIRPRDDHHSAPPIVVPPPVAMVVSPRKNRCGTACCAVVLVVLLLCVLGGAVAYFASAGAWFASVSAAAPAVALDDAVLGVNMMYFSKYTQHAISSATSRRLYHDTIADIASSQNCYEQRVEAKAENRLCIELLHPPDDDYLHAAETHFKERGPYRSAVYSRRRELALAYYVCCFSNFEEFTYLVSEVVAPYDEEMAVTLVTRVGVVAGVISETGAATAGATTRNASAASK